MEFVKYNLNWLVKVKLTRLGKKILWEQRKALNDSIIARGGIPLSGPIFTEDADGYCEMQMWNLMDDFSGHISVCGELPFSTNVMIEVEESKSSEKTRAVCELDNRGSE